MKKDDKVTIIVVFTLCVVFGLLAFLFSIKSNYEKLSIVKDYDIFFSVSGEANKYINYISSKNSNDIVNVLSDKYVQNNLINNDNVFNYVDNYSGDISLRVNNIYFSKIKNNYLYLVSGSINENNFYGVNIINSNYRVLILNDISNNSYAIYPVTEDNYKDIINSIKRIIINKNNSNEMIKSNSVSDVDICKLYFSDYMNMLFNDIDSAYSLLDNNMLNDYSSVDEFRRYLSDNRDLLTSSSSMCGSEEFEDQRIYIVIDKFDNTYRFTEEGIMNYKVSFNLKRESE